MTDVRHNFWERFGAPITVRELRHGHARALADYAASGLDDEAAFLECRRSGAGHEAVLVRVRTYPPQRPAADIRHEEELAAVFTGDSRSPALLSMRFNFPETPHQNIMPEGMPRYPCVDDRPWDDAAPGWTPCAYLDRVRWWLNAAAMGELTGTGQVVDPLLIATGPDLLVPVELLTHPPDNLSFVLAPTEGVIDDKVRCLHMVRTDGRPVPGLYGFRGLHVAAPVAAARSISMPPENLNQLLCRMTDAGLNLVARLQNWVRALPAEGRTSRPVLLLTVPVVGTGDGPARPDVTAFVLQCSIGKLGTLLGVLHPLPDKDGEWGTLLMAGPVDAGPLEAEKLLSMTVQVEFGAELARPLSGIALSNTSKAMLVGAGAIGSHVAMTLTREGRHAWTVVDSDWLRPHNLARHVLGQPQVGRMKAPELADCLRKLGRVSADSIVCDVQHPGEQGEALEAAAGAAEVIIDASASVSAARRVSDWTFTQARRVSVFFNPAGTAAVLLAEDAERNIRLDQLEARYYRAVLRDASLVEHLVPPPEGYRYAGGCRAVSARIPESRVATLSGLAASGISAALASKTAGLSIWSMQPGGSVALVCVQPSTVRREVLLGWTVLLDDEIAAEISTRRAAALPDETGGALVGVVDFRRKVIAVVDALSPPPDSRGDAGSFTRGVKGLEERLRAVSDRTGGIVRYIGEWHTHPRWSVSLPSLTDLQQLLTLRHELQREGLPATMLIAGCDGERTVLLDTPGRVHEEAAQ